MRVAFLLFLGLLQLSAAFQLGALRSASAVRSSAVVMGVSYKVGDTVEMITGDYKGEAGKIISVDKKKGKLVVEGINMQTKHMKPMKEGEQGRIMKREAPVHISNARHAC